MYQSTRCYCAAIVILLAGGLSCNRSVPISKQPRPATSQPLLAEQAEGLDTSTPDSGTQETSASADWPDAPSIADKPAGASTQTTDAEDVLKDALARAADEQKLVLVHIGAPG